MRIQQLRNKTQTFIANHGVKAIHDFIDAVRLSQSPFLQGAMDHLIKWETAEEARTWIPWLEYGQFSRDYHTNLRSKAWLELSHELKERSLHCIVCATNRGLHLHHTFYADHQYSTLPWLYPIRSLVTICRSCHNELHALENWKEEQFSMFRHYSHTDWLDL